MKSDAPLEPLDFAQRFLQLHGAAVERDGPAVEALVPEHLQALLDTPEHIRVSDDPAIAAGSQNSYPITDGSPLLERMIGKTLESVVLAGCRLEFDYVKSGGFDRLLREHLTFYGAKATIETVADVSAAYLLLACRYTAQSDEQKEGLLNMAFSQDTRGFVPEMAGALDSAVCRKVFAGPDTDAQKTITALSEPIEQAARRLLEDRLEPFRAAMNRRFQRDIANLCEYYESLEQEMQKNLEKPGLSESARNERRAKIEALPSELAIKKDDLYKKYSIKVRLQSTAAMQIRTPAKKIACRLSIGRQSRQFFLTYNPVTRKPDPPPCTRCRTPITHIHFDDSLAPVCFACKEAAA